MWRANAAPSDTSTPAAILILAQSVIVRTLNKLGNPLVDFIELLVAFLNFVVRFVRFNIHFDLFLIF